MTGSSSGQITTCYRHPEREWYARCLRCNRPVCRRCFHHSAICVPCARSDTGRSFGRVEAARGWAAAGLILALTAGSIYYWMFSEGHASEPAPPGRVRLARSVERRGPAGPVPPGLDRFYGQTLTWDGCAGYAVNDTERSQFGRPDVQCARLTVPLDYGHPQGAVITLGLLRRAALDPSKRIGSLLINPGGPGESGMVDAAGSANTAKGLDVAQRFDFVGFDPRGVGASQPAIHCLTDAERDADRAGTMHKQLGPECAQHTDMGAAMLAHVGTKDTARDMDVLRSALGDQELTYLGYSYGTNLGSTYAALFPHNVRALLLDGAVDPRQDPATEFSSTSDSTDGNLDDKVLAVFNEFARWCAARQDCALGADPGHAKPELDNLTHPLERKPADVGDGRKLSESDAITAVVQAMYGQDEWNELNQGLNDLKQARGGRLMSLADEYYGRGRDGKYSNSTDARLAVDCADHDCDSWPVRPTGLPQPHPQPGLPPALVISTTMDPVTPLPGGKKLAAALGGRLLTVKADQHTAFLYWENRNYCVDEAGSAYLTDLKLPPENTLC